MSTPSALTITIGSAAVLGDIAHDAITVDSDIEIDDDGLPLIRRHRLSSRLRDTALVVSAADTEIAALLEPVLGGARTIGLRRQLIIGHARPAQAVRSMAHRAVQKETDNRPQGPHILAGRIRDAHTVTVVSTRLDEYGAPVRATLRARRGLRPGVILTAPLCWRDPPSEDTLSAFAKCVVLTEQIGTGESRGLGQVRCALDGDRAATMTLAWGAP